MKEVLFFVLLVLVLHVSCVASQQPPFCNVSSTFLGENCMNSSSFTNEECSSLNCCFTRSRFRRRCIKKKESLQLSYYNGRGSVPSPIISPRRQSLFVGGVPGYPGSIVIKTCLPNSRNIQSCGSANGNQSYSDCIKKYCCWGPQGCYKASFYIIRLRTVCEPGSQNPPKCEDIDECASNPCSNNGICKNGLNEFTCECPDGTSGDRCQQVCSSAPRIAFGESSPSGPFNTNDQVGYICNTGYELIGENTLICQNDGSFSPNPPTCVRKCTNPPPVNSFVNFTSLSGNNVYLNNDVVIYFCENNKTISPNPATNQCINGIWTSAAPTCYDCDQPPLAAGGTFVPNKYFFVENDMVTYQCFSGSVLVGSDTNTCRIGNNWSNPAPTCNSSVCPAFPDFNNGQVIYSQGDETQPAPIGVVANVSCNSPYFLDSLVSTYTCENTVNSVQWIPQTVPSCMLGCAIPPDNPPLMYAGLGEGDVVQNGFLIIASCMAGFNLNDFEFYVCNTTNLPNFNQSECRRNCPQPPVGLQNSMLGNVSLPPDSANTYQQGATATYDCVGGQLRDGVPTSTCGSDGIWSVLFYDCDAVCSSINSPNGSSPFPNPDNSIIFEGQVVEFRCDNETQTLRGGNQTTCQENGMFLPDPSLFQPCML